MTFLKLKIPTILEVLELSNFLCILNESDEEFSVTVVETPEKTVQKRKVTEALKPNKKLKQDKTQTINKLLSFVIFVKLA